MYKNKEQFVNEIKRVHIKIFKEKISNELLENHEKVIDDYILIWRRRGQKYKLENYYKSLSKSLENQYGYSKRKEISNYLELIRNIIKKTEKSEDKLKVFSDM